MFTKWGTASLLRQTLTPDWVAGKAWLILDLATTHDPPGPSSVAPH